MVVLVVVVLEIVNVTWWYPSVYGLRNSRDFPLENQVRQQFKSDGNIINKEASKGLRELQITSIMLQMASLGISGSVRRP